MLSGVGYANAALPVTTTSDNTDGAADPGDSTSHGRGPLEAAREVHFATRSISGDVTSVTAATVTIQSPDGISQEFQVDSATSIRRNGDPVGIADIRVGDKARATGIVAAGVVVAKRIGTLTPEEATQKQADRAKQIRDRLSGSKTTRHPSPAR
jgi:hypothetical protein